MKNLKKTYWLLLVILLNFSCIKEPCNMHAKVKITAPQTEFSVESGDTLFIKYTLTPDSNHCGELGMLVLLPEQGVFPYEQHSDSIFSQKQYSGTNPVTDSVMYIVKDTIGTKNYLNLLAIEGKTFNSTKLRISINVVDAPEVDTIGLQTITGITARYISTSLDNEMMFYLTDSNVLVLSAKDSIGDLAFVYQHTYGYSICAPNADWIHDLYSYNGINYTTSNKKETKIQLYTGNWADLTLETIDSLTVITSTIAGGGNGVQNLNEGDIVIFETEDGRKGALLVKTNVKITRRMTADFKYLKIVGTK